jgi:hypothetical protein
LPSRLTSEEVTTTHSNAAATTEATIIMCVEKKRVDLFLYFRLGVINLGVRLGVRVRIIIKNDN